MEPIGGTGFPSESYGVKSVGIESEDYQFEEELQGTMEGGAPPVSGSSFTALLELPPSQAMELLHTAGAGECPADLSGNVLNRHRISNQIPFNHTLNCSPAFPLNAALIERAAKYSVFANGGAALPSGDGGSIGNCSPDASSPPSNLSGSTLKVKSEPADSNSNPNSSHQVSDPASLNEKTAKRKEREKKGKGSSKKCKSVANEFPEDGEKLPYVHVRARRGQATDSHSLAERARREKINARMKLLQELVPGCNKVCVSLLAVLECLEWNVWLYNEDEFVMGKISKIISGTALVLDEIINHVQSLQRQVEYLSMRLAAVSPRIDFNLDSLLAGNGALVDNNYQSVAMPSTWPEIQMNSDRQQSQQQWHVQSSTHPIWIREEDHRSLINPESSLLSYGSPHSVPLHSSQLKMEL
ncbi:hypothetical protein V2J09_015951 [Rumex salicifolius]